MITLSKFQNRGVVATTTHRKSIINGEEYELILKGVSTPLLVKIVKDNSGKYNPSQSYSIFNSSVGAYSSSNPQNTEDDAMDEIFNNSLSFYNIGQAFNMEDNPGY